MSCRCRPSCSRWTSRAKASPRRTLSTGFLENTIFQSVVPSTLHILISVYWNLFVCYVHGGRGQGGQVGPSGGSLGLAGPSALPRCAEQG